VRHKGTPEIVEAPRRHGLVDASALAGTIDASVELGLRFGPAGKATDPQTKYELAPSPMLDWGKNRQSGARERDYVGSMVLRPLCWEFNVTSLEVDLMPPEIPDLLSALAGEDQQFDDCPIVIIARSSPNLDQLVVS
jgi:hypothetical protein